MCFIQNGFKRSLQIKKTRLTIKCKANWKDNTTQDIEVNRYTKHGIGGDRYTKNQSNPCSPNKIDNMKLDNNIINI